jgi:hypothetical protein
VNPLQAANLTIRFLLELCALASLAYWGWQAGDSDAVHAVLAIGAPLLAATVWGLFVAPRATHPLDPVPKLIVELLVFGAAGAALAAAGHAGLGVLFFIVAVVNGALVRMLGGEPAPVPRARPRARS